MDREVFSLCGQIFTRDIFKTNTFELHLTTFCFFRRVIFQGQSNFNVFWGHLLKRSALYFICYKSVLQICIQSCRVLTLKKELMCSVAFAFLQEISKCNQRISMKFCKYVVPGPMMSLFHFKTDPDRTEFFVLFFKTLQDRAFVSFFAYFMKNLAYACVLCTKAKL